MKVLIILLLALSQMACDYDFPIFNAKGSGEPGVDSLALEMIRNQYSQGGADEILHIENFKELSRSKVQGGYSYNVRYDLVIHANAEDLRKTMKSRSVYGHNPDSDIDKLIRQFGNFKSGDRIPMREQISVVRGMKGLELQRY